MYYDYSDLKPFIDAGIAPAKTKQAQQLAQKINKLRKEKDDAQEEWGKLIKELEQVATDKAITDFKKEKGIVVNQPFIATPKFAGKVLNVIITTIKLNHRKEPVLIAAVIGRDGGVRETREINAISWDLVPAEKVRSAANKRRENHQ
jgi:hypothetical protein